MTENGYRGLDGLHTALNWTVPALNVSTFVNGCTPMQLASSWETAQHAWSHL